VGTARPASFGNWINTLQGAARDSAISAYSASLAPRDPGTALGWAQSISSDSIRTSTVDQLVAQWLQRDPTTASEWINRSELPTRRKCACCCLGVEHRRNRLGRFSTVAFYGRAVFECKNGSLMVCKALQNSFSQLEIRCSIRLSYERKCRSESIQAALNRNRHV